MVTKAEKLFYVQSFIEEAKKKHNAVIFPVRYFKTFTAGITEEFLGEERFLIFWYNTIDHSTHTLTRKIK